MSSWSHYYYYYYHHHHHHHHHHSPLSTRAQRGEVQIQASSPDSTAYPASPPAAHSIPSAQGSPRQGQKGHPLPACFPHSQSSTGSTSALEIPLDSLTPSPQGQGPYLSERQRRPTPFGRVPDHSLVWDGSAGKVDGIQKWSSKRGLPGAAQDRSHGRSEIPQNSPFPGNVDGQGHHLKAQQSMSLGGCLASDFF